MCAQVQRRREKYTRAWRTGKNSPALISWRIPTPNTSSTLFGAEGECFYNIIMSNDFTKMQLAVEWATGVSLSQQHCGSRHSHWCTFIPVSVLLKCRSRQHTAKESAPAAAVVLDKPSLHRVIFRYNIRITTKVIDKERSISWDAGGKSVWSLERIV